MLRNKKLTGEKIILLLRRSFKIMCSIVRGEKNRLKNRERNLNKDRDRDRKIKINRCKSIIPSKIEARLQPNLLTNQILTRT